jgi:hypothetical protein
MPIRPWQVHIPRSKVFNEAPNRFDSEFLSFVSRRASEREYFGDAQDHADDHEGARL